MNKETLFLKCKETGAVVGLLEEGSEPICCGNKAMEKAEISDGNDIITIVKNESKVGVIVSVPVNWVYLRTNRGGHRKSATECEQVSFILSDETPEAVFAYTDDKRLCRKDFV